MLSQRARCRSPETASQPAGWLGRVLGVLALLAQLAAVTQISGPSIVTLARDGICHTSSDADAGGQPGGLPHRADCALCPLCLSLALPSPVPPPGPAAPAAPSVAVDARSVLPEAPAPPVAERLLAQPRAPPAAA